MTKYKALKNHTFKCGTYDDKREYLVEKGKEYDIHVRCKQLELDGVLQLIEKTIDTK